MTTGTKKAKAQQPQTDTQQPLVLANGTPPDMDAMKKAAGILKIPVPAGSGDAAKRELLGALRLKNKELLAPVPKAQQLVCENCGERSTEATDFCPFCGDLGINEGEQAQQEGAGISSTPAAPTKDVEGKIEVLVGELDLKTKRIGELKLAVVDSSYDIGLLVKEIHDRQLWKAKGYSNFKQFAEKELPISRNTAYQLVHIVERFDKKTYLDVGYKKLRTIASIDDADTREQLLEEAKSGVSARQLDEKVRPAKGRSPAKTESKAKGGDAAPPEEKSAVSFVGRVDGKPKEVALKQAKDGKRIQSAGKVTMVVAGAYGEIEITPDVFLRVALRVQGKDIVGFSAEFVRAE